jgi:CheY-like chemotaxis protein
MTSSLITTARNPPVLLVDHDAESAARYAVRLASLGFRPAHVRTANEGLEAARRLRPDVVVTAMLFPSPIDGLELTRRLRCDPATKHARIILLTGRAYTTDREAAERAGCDLFLTKPCEAALLAAEIRRLLKSRPRSGRAVPHDPTEPVLVWSRRGEVACVNHAPERDSDRWTAEAWQPLPPRVVNGRVRYQCQYCAGTPIAHDTRAAYQSRITTRVAEDSEDAGVAAGSDGVHAVQV